MGLLSDLFFTLGFEISVIKLFYGYWHLKADERLGDPPPR